MPGKKQPISLLLQLIKKKNDTDTTAPWDLNSKEANTSLQPVLSGYVGNTMHYSGKLKLPRKKKVKQM